ncbi:ribose transport system permease protein [Plasticicumulans lactativorans]|uniref:Ribose transport system permease protein n=1 Tax=Plasticicumulans lactativorans TaxID=1133106 RepID=A0A4R2LDW9_9GAMM|nr:ribose ABC transporter permease [Plasticicumulans lactativorans]TCO82812.1 ribose transport system permease protein [Plasticicumulans lactativorans]
MSTATTTATPPATKANLGRYLRAAGILPVLILIGGAFALMSPNFLTGNNLLNIMQQASVNIVLATGMTFVILTAGIDLSVGAILGCAAVLTMTASLIPGLGWAAVPVGLLSGLVMGLMNGALIAGFRLPPFIVTLGSFTAMRGLAYLFASGGSITNMEINFAWIGNNYFLGLPWLVWIALIVVAVSWVLLNRTVLGLHIYAVGGNPEAARLAGLRVGRVLLIVYAISGLLSGLAGVMMSSRLFNADGKLGTGYELDAIAAVILGGTSFVGGIGTVVGTLFGALIIAVLNNGLTLMNVSFFWQLVIKGLVIVIAVLIDKYRNSANRRA